MESTNIYRRTRRKTKQNKAKRASKKTKKQKQTKKRNKKASKQNKTSKAKPKLNQRQTQSTNTTWCISNFRSQTGGRQAGSHVSMSFKLLKHIFANIHLNLVQLKDSWSAKGTRISLSVLICSSKANNAPQKCTPILRTYPCKINFERLLILKTDVL